MINAHNKQLLKEAEILETNNAKNFILLGSEASSNTLRKTFIDISSESFEESGIMKETSEKRDYTVYPSSDISEKLKIFNKYSEYLN